MESFVNLNERSMADQIKQQLKPLILQGLRLTDLSPADLKDDQPLLDSELEIDSIDILQLILEVERHFGIKLVSGRFDRDVWQNITTLAAAIEKKIQEEVSAGPTAPTAKEVAL